MPPLAHYLQQYDQEHRSAWNKALHGVGIPMIFLGLALLLLMRWRAGLALFAGGWMLLFAGHRIEGNRPAFFQGAIYFAVGPLWVAKEVKEAVFGGRRRKQAGKGKMGRGSA